MSTKFFNENHKVLRTADFTTMTKDFRASYVQEKMTAYLSSPTEENKNELENFIKLNQLCIDGKRPLIYDENRKRVKYADDIEVTYTAVLPYDKMTTAEKLAACEDYIRRMEK